MLITAEADDRQILAEIGQRIVRARQAHGWSRAELARRAEIARSTVARVESGASVQLASLLRILRALWRLPHLDLLLDQAPPPSPLAEYYREARRHGWPIGPDWDGTWGE